MSVLNSSSFLDHILNFANVEDSFGLPWCKTSCQQARDQQKLAEVVMQVENVTYTQ